jgi:Flp pilus assembly protein TadD
VVLLAGLTWRQSRTYRDPETLYRSALAGNPQCWMADYNLGVTLHRQGRIAEATGCYERAIELRPGLEFPQAQNNLGVILTDAGKGGDAVPHLQAAVAGYSRNARLAKDGAEAEGNLGRALQQAGRDTEAVDHFRKALVVGSDRPELRNNYAVALIRSGRPAEAERQLELALTLHPDDVAARDNLALLRRLLNEPH